MSCEKIVNTWCQEYTEACFKDPSNFEKPIKWRKVKNFSSAAVKTSVKQNNKVTELKGTRDLFGRLLYLSTIQDIDLKKVFMYPLTPIPLALGHLYGSINTTDKSKLMHKLEGRIQSTVPVTPPEVCIVDAMFLIHTIRNVPGTFGELADKLLAKLCELLPRRIDLVCDTYVTPSIKDT